MLPLLPSPPGRAPSLPAPVPALLLSGLLTLLLLLGGCGRVGQPPRSVLLDALSLQIQLTQGAIARALDLQADGLPEVSRVRVDGQEPIAIGDDRGLHLMGRFDWRLPGDAIRVDSPFDLYLQPGPRGESWRLARPSGSSDDSSQNWITDPLPLPRRSRG